MSAEHKRSPNPIVEIAKNHFLQTIAKGSPIYAYYPEHVENAELWATKILHYFPEADNEIVLLAVQLHDIGHADGKYWEDHAIKSELETISFLTKIGYPESRINQVAHCVRAHRCRDVTPNTIEARILAAADSASHMTDFVYIVMLKQNHLSRDDIQAKIDRDYHDAEWLPKELIDEITPLYKAWKKLIGVLPT